MTEIKVFDTGTVTILKKIPCDEYFEYVGSIYKRIDSDDGNVLCINLSDLSLIRINESLTVYRKFIKEIEIKVMYE